MSSFAPLNLNEDSSFSKKDLEEEYTRELAIEQAFKSFEEALKLQDSGSLKSAYFTYKELFKLEVISNHYFEERDFIKGIQNGGSNNIADELSFLSPNVKTLRYLVFRNRGFLYYEILKSGQDFINEIYLDEKNKKSEIARKSNDEEVSDMEEVTLKDFFKQLFYVMIDDFIICLIYQDADEKLLNTIYDIFIYLDIKKLIRFTLEYTLSGKSESDDILGLLPINSKALKKYHHLLSRLNDSSTPFDKSYLDKELNFVNKRLFFLKPIKDEFLEQIENIKKNNVVEIPIRGALNWGSIIDDINDFLKKNQDKEKVHDFSKAKIKDLDPYYLTESSIEKITFKIPEIKSLDENDEFFDAQEENNELKKEDPIEEPENKVEIIVDADEDRKNPNKPQVQRSSKRLARNDSITDEIQIIELTKDSFFNTNTFLKELNEYLNLLDDKEEHLKVGDITEIYLNNDRLDDELEEVRKNAQESFANVSPYIKDFLKIINNWNPRVFTSGLFVTESSESPSVSEDEKVKLLEVLSNFGSKKDTSKSDETIPELSNYENQDIILNLLKSISDSSCHLETCKMSILEHLFGCHLYNSSLDVTKRVCLISDTIWPKKLYEKVKEWLIQSENFLMNYWKINTPNPNNALECFPFMIGIFEVLVDTYVGIIDQVNNLIASQGKKPQSKSTKANLSSLTTEMIKFNDKINKWNELIESQIFSLLPLDELCKIDGLSYYIRYKWALIFKEKARNTAWEENRYIAIQLQELLTLLNQYEMMDIRIPLPNYENICEVSIELINYQSITAYVLSMFSKILYTNDTDDEAIQILESILISKSNESSKNEIKLNGNNQDKILTMIEGSEIELDSLNSVKAFLDKYPIDMKLNLWNILFLYYDEKKQFPKFQYGFENNLEFLLTYLSSETYLENKGSRYPILLKVLGSYGDYLNSYLTRLAENSWHLPNLDIIALHKTLKNLLKFFEMLSLYFIHEDASRITSSKLSVKSKSSKAYNKLFDIHIQTICVFSIYFREYIMKTQGNNQSTTKNIEEIIHNLLSSFHYMLALISLCDGADGLFLRLSQEILLGLKCSTEKELIQLISCRFHYSVNIGSFAPFDHKTNQTGQLDSNSTADLVRFVLPLCFKKNPLLYAPKADMKLLIDGLYEVVGDPDFDSDDFLTLNNETFKYFLQSTSITPKFLKEAFYGLVKLDFDPPKNNLSVVHDGLYYLQALLIFNSYKIRKKSMQSRAVELEHIILLLKNDLIYCSNRVESWFLLGQAYGFLVEDDLIWTSDKLTIADRKITTANLQRKSLICYLMAINQASSIGATNPGASATIKPVIGLLMSSFAKEAYSAVMEPMAMHAFKVQANPRFVKGEFGALFINVSPESPVKMNLVLKVIQQSLHIAIRAKPFEWTNYYYLSKVQRKLDKPHQLVMESIQRSAELAKNHTNAPDPIIEPHYRSCSLIYKYVKADKMDIPTALAYMAKDSVIDVPLTEEEKAKLDKKEFFKLMIASLKKIISYDKKKWQHKPRYRLAKILFEEFDDFENAKEEMSSIVSVKSTSKTLVLIWKPENERPGIHFFYTYQYSLFYIILLSKELNLISLIQMLPKLRRSNSTMVSLYNAWETLCSTICKIIRTLLQVKESFTENFLQSFSYQSFILNSKSFVESMKNGGIPDALKIHLCFLHAINDMKKFNNGFGPTSLIDDTIVAIYVRIYLYFDHKIDKNPSQAPETESPNGKIKKLAKRDIFPFANDILNTFKKDIENILKENPEIYNQFAKEANQLNKILEEVKPNGSEIPSTINDAKNDEGNTINGHNQEPALGVPKLPEPGNSNDGSPAKQVETTDNLDTPIPISPEKSGEKHILEDGDLLSPKRPKSNRISDLIG